MLAMCEESGSKRVWNPYEQDRRNVIRIPPAGGWVRGDMRPMSSVKQPVREYRHEGWKSRTFSSDKCAFYYLRSLALCIPSSTRRLRT